MWKWSAIGYFGGTERNDTTSRVGGVFTPTNNILVRAFARFAASGGATEHTVGLYNCESDWSPVVEAVTPAGDPGTWCQVQLPEPVLIGNGTVLALASQETADTDGWIDPETSVQEAGNTWLGPIIQPETGPEYESQKVYASLMFEFAEIP